MNRAVLKDAAARERIRGVLDKNIMVEAGAGSGKTTCLIERMSALVVSGTCSIENVAAITFTRKAAGELREKFQLELEKLLQKEKDQKVRERLSNALVKIDRAFLGTIHSFCGRLLRERPVEAGINPNFTEIQGLEEELLAEKCWQEYLLEVRLNKPEQLEKLEEMDLSPYDLKEAFFQLAYYPDVDIVCEEVPLPDLAPVKKQLEHFLQMAGKHLPGKEPSQGWDDLQKIIRLGFQWQRMFDLNDHRFFLRLLERMDKKAKPTLKRWLSKEGAREANENFDNFKENTIQPVLQSWREYRHYHIIEFLLPAANGYQGFRLKENKLNFQDLLMSAAALLKENPEVRTYFQERYTRLLVDEFQDTDPIQAEVMFYLTGEDTREKDWTQLKPSPGKLFVVGDPKQSIYRFRRADIDIYNQVKEKILESDGEVLYLTTNFRSLPLLIDWTNEAFEREFSLCSAPYQTVFTPMDKFSTPGQDSGVFKMTVDTKKSNQEIIAQTDAEKIAYWMDQALEGTLKLARTPEELEAGLTEKPVPGDFLILLRYKSNMALYGRALEKYGIPFSLSGGSSISASLELNELIHVLSTIADPDNPIPLVTVLRGLFFGISDQQLYLFKEAGGRFNFMTSVPKNAEWEVFNIFNNAFDLLKCFLRWSQELPPSSAIEKIARELGIIPLALSQDLGKGRAGYVMQALELLRAQEQQGETEFTAAAELLNRLLDKGLEEEVDLEGGVSPTVRIMNLHKAKGLEAPVVILANPGKSSTHEPTIHIQRQKGQARGYLTINKPGNYGSFLLAQPRDWEFYQGEERQYQEAEETRLLYVAATRAKNVVVVSTYPKNPARSPWFPLERSLEDKEEIEVFPVNPVERGGDKQAISPQQLAAVREEIRVNLEEIKKPTYLYTCASDLKGETAPKRKHTGRGASWGNVLHRTLEVLQEVRDEEELEKHVVLILEQEGRLKVEKDEVLRVIKDIKGTEFWQRAAAAEIKLWEVPFGIWEGDMYSTGTIDLAWREEQGWIIADYKSDFVEDGEHLQELTSYYRPQLEMYSRCFEKITGEKPVEKGLFFIDVLKFVK